MKLILKQASIVSYGGKITEDGPTLRVVFQCPLTPRIAAGLGIHNTVYATPDPNTHLALRPFDKIELQGRIEQADILMAPNADHSYDTLIDGFVDRLIVVKDDGGALLRFRVNTMLDDEPMVTYIKSQRREPVHSITIEAKQGNLFGQMDAGPEPGEKQAKLAIVGK